MPERELPRLNRTITVPYSPTEWALVKAPFPMSADEWNAFIETLNAMSCGLVVSTQASVALATTTPAPVDEEKR